MGGGAEVGITPCPLTGDWDRDRAEREIGNIQEQYRPAIEQKYVLQRIANRILLGMGIGGGGLGGGICHVTLP